MMRSLLVVLILMLAGTAVAQPAQPAPVAPPLPPPPAGPICKLATPPPPQDPNAKTKPETRESEYRQFCEDELLADHDWWFTLEERLIRRVHKQASAEATANNRHVVMAYAAMWLLAVGFVVVLWRRQQRLKAEIERLSSELKKAEGS